MKKYNMGKVLGIDGIPADILKYGDAIVVWMLMICNFAWEESEVLED